jgi:glycogen phosphorylase
MSEKKHNTWQHPYTPSPKYSKRVAYFCMEFAIHQPLKLYSGGLGYLAGSHMRSAYELKQNLIGIGIHWKYGYFNQTSDEFRQMTVQWQAKNYNFLEDTGIIVPVYVDRHQIYVKALYLRPEVFNTVPMYLLTTDIPENDYLAQTITHKLYDGDLAARIAQSIVLGIGGAKVVEALGGADVYHINEGHALPVAFYLYSKYKDLEEVKKRFVFTPHTPEKAENAVHELWLLDKMSFFNFTPLPEVRKITGIEGEDLDYTLTALRMAKIANGVSKIHGEVSRKMWEGNSGICPIISITNAQNKRYWADTDLVKALSVHDDEALLKRKRHLKKRLFEVVGDQTGELFDPDVLTIVWARRFAGYKRPDLLIADYERFMSLISKKDKPVQIIWAGKPYPLDQSGISTFNHLVRYTQKMSNCAVLTGYELTLSRLLKCGADVWLNTPRRPQEASGTSGMTAAMNGAINFSVVDGWVAEFARHGENAFLIPPVDTSLPLDEQDRIDCQNMYDVLENEIIPLYYDHHDKWLELMKRSMGEVTPYFDSGRMADEYYTLMYNA